MSPDRETLEVYSARIGDYTKRFTHRETPDRHLRRFIAAMPPNAFVLDLGCGPGQASAFLAAAGHRPDPIDASADMVRHARSHYGLPARVASFDDLKATDLYDGVWANFSLLHASRAAVPGHLARIGAALKRSGTLHLGLKRGQGERRDALGRFYSYWEEDELRAMLTEIGLTAVDVEHGSEAGLAGTAEPWIILLAHA